MPPETGRDGDHAQEQQRANRAAPQQSSQHGLSNTSSKYVGPPSVLLHYPIPLQIGPWYYTSLAPDSQQIFQFDWPWGSRLAVYCRGFALQGKAAMYLKFGSPPTLENWDRQAEPYSNGIRIEIWGSTPVGTHYILIHGLAYHRSVSVQVGALIS